MQLGGVALHEGPYWRRQPVRPVRPGRGEAADAVQYLPGRRAAGRVAVQAGPHHADEVGGQAVESGLVVHRAVHQRVGRPAAERTLAGRGEDQHRAEREHVASAGPTSAPLTCSGDRKPGVPRNTPVAVSRTALQRREMPKSMTRGPSAASSTLDGLRSRWTSPAAWIACSASASPAASAADRGCGQRAVVRHRLLERGTHDVLGGQPRPGCLRVGVDDTGGPEAADRAGHRHLAAEPLAEVRARRPGPCGRP